MLLYMVSHQHTNHTIPQQKKFIIQSIRSESQTQLSTNSTLKQLVLRRQLNKYLLTKYTLEFAVETSKKNMTFTHRGLAVYKVCKMKSFRM